MLARANRLVSADDYRSVLRRGRRISGVGTVVSIVTTGPERTARFGFVVSRKVGNAVNRNRVRRRMKAVAGELIATGTTGVDVVVRALPTVTALDWPALRSELRDAVNRGTP